MLVIDNNMVTHAPHSPPHGPTRARTRSLGSLGEGPLAPGALQTSAPWLLPLCRPRAPRWRATGRVRAGEWEHGKMEETEEGELPRMVVLAGVRGGRIRVATAAQVRRIVRGRRRAEEEEVVVVCGGVRIGALEGALARVGGGTG